MNASTASLTTAAWPYPVTTRRAWTVLSSAGDQVPYFAGSGVLLADASDSTRKEIISST